MEIPYIDIPWHNSINLVNWNSRARYNQECVSLKLVESLNVSIIISSCTIIEGFLNSTLKDHIFIIDTKTNPKVVIQGIEMTFLELKKCEFIKRILDDYTLTLQQGKFDNYLRIFKILVDIDIKKSIPDEVFEGTRKMFQLRNQFVHGAEIEYEEIKDKEGRKLNTPIGKYRSVVDYLNKPNIGLNLIESGKVHLLKNEVANHFHSITNEFITNLNNSLHQSQRTMLPEKLKILLDGNTKYCD